MSKTRMCWQRCWSDFRKTIQNRLELFVKKRPCPKGRGLGGDILQESLFNNISFYLFHNNLPIRTAQSAVFLLEGLRNLDFHQFDVFYVIMSHKQTERIGR
mgnify:CR=1 FL=1